MAFTKQTTFKGIDLTAYYKVTSYEVMSEVVEDVKSYVVQASVNSYTNSTKEYDIEQKTYIIKGLQESEVTLPTIYEKLKLEEDFNGSIDA